MDDNLPNPKTVDTDTPKTDVGFVPASPPPLDPMTPPDEVQIDPVPLPSVTSQGGPASPNPPAGGEGEPLPPDMEHPVPPASPSQGGPASPNPPAGGEGGPKPPVAFAEEPTIKPPSSAPVHSPQEKKRKTGGGKKIIAGIAALVLLVTALAGGLYILKIPGVGEIRKEAEGRWCSGVCGSGNCQFNGCQATQSWNMVRVHCDQISPLGCGGNQKESSYTSSMSFQESCGSEQIDAYDANSNPQGWAHRDYATNCGAVASPTPIPTPTPPLGTCGTPCNDNTDCGGGLGCTCSDANADPLCGVCWNDDDTPNVCGGNETPTPVPTSTPGPSPTPGTAQCIDVRSQIQSGGTWVDNDLSLARIGDNIRFVARVSATAAGVSFQITSGTGVPQTVAGTLLSTTATTKEYAAEYTIPASGQLSVAATVQ